MNEHGYVSDRMIVVFGVVFLVANMACFVWMSAIGSPVAWLNLATIFFLSYALGRNALLLWRD